MQPVRAPDAFARRATLAIAGFPGRYVQGPGALDVLAEPLRDLGARRVAVVTDVTADPAMIRRAMRTLDAGGLKAIQLRLDGECTTGSIATLAVEARLAGADAVVGLGGTRAVDTAKGIAHGGRLGLVLVPAPVEDATAASPLIPLVDDALRVVGTRMLARSPDAVLVDTAHFARVPVRYFRAALGDALAACAPLPSKGAPLNLHGARPPPSAGLATEHCRTVLHAHAEQALRDVSAATVTPAVESVTEAIVLLGALGESAGLPVARALLFGLSAVPALTVSMRGELAAFGSLVQRVVQGDSDEEIASHLDLLGRLGLPRTLARLGLGLATSSDVQLIAMLTLQAVRARGTGSDLRQEALAAAIDEADRRGRC